ncbi:cyanophycinase [Massilia soli]|uniref:Cyanophycinase n=1 Tax=Massilia soli TaxID=2792854 RepID=A0ABS7SNC9_9BURK|nr:cyanophycinase [Massilia soli]MBZ2207681.1 cyanophycinase [Massilia soli]
MRHYSFMLGRLAGFFLLLVAVSAQAAAKGSLVIAGGALRADNAVVWQRIVALAGGQGARIAVIPAAAGNPERSGKQLVQTLSRYGAAAFVLPVAPRLPGDVRKAANDPALAAAVRSAGGVYFSGGDQGRITQALRNPDGSNSLVLDAVWEMYRRGGVIAGTSAGAAIMSSTMFYEAGSVLATLQNGVEDGREIAPGLGFVGNELFIDQHLLIRGRFARMLPVMVKKGYRLGLGIDENTAAVVGPDRQLEVIGYKGALLLDLARATVDRQQTAFNVSNVAISYLDHGDRLDLASGALLPSGDKADGKVDPARPANFGAVYTADILGNTTVVDVMAKLVDSDQTQALGLAFGGPPAAAGKAGFEFRFSRTADTIGYASATSEAYSVYRLRLDVRPIALGWPQYDYR